jgi:immunity protein Imm1 of predicted polymorphic toxin system
MSESVRLVDEILKMNHVDWETTLYIGDVEFHSTKKGPFPNHQLRLSVRPTVGLAAINYMDHGDPHMPIVNSYNPKRPLPDIDLIFGGATKSTFPRTAAIPITDARNALIEWLETQKRPTCIEWRPYDSYWTKETIIRVRDPAPARPLGARLAGEPLAAEHSTTARGSGMSGAALHHLGHRDQRWRSGRPDDQPPTPMPPQPDTVTGIPFIPSADGARLAVVLRSAQWTLDDLAHDLPAGRCTPQRLRELATVLEQLAVALRAATGEVSTAIESGTCE